MKKQFIKVKVDNLDGLTKNKLYPVLCVDHCDMALVYIFINDDGKVVHENDWGDEFYDKFKVKKVKMTKREIMIFNAGVSHGMISARYRAEEFTRKGGDVYLAKQNAEKQGWLWLSDRIEDYIHEIYRLQYEETDHLYSHKDGYCV